MTSRLPAVGTAIRAALLTGEARAKVFATRRVARDFRLGRLACAFPEEMPARPAWPAALRLEQPGAMPKRGKAGSDATRIAFWHALAHIEFVAIDLALDMAGRFGADRDAHFVSDFLQVAADEAMHFALISRKLDSLGSFYGALPAHDGLWSAAFETRGDLAARLAVVPMVLEARGLDVTPQMILRIRSQGDENGAKILERILDDEIRHVAVGTKHFLRVSEQRAENAQDLWRKIISSRFAGRLKPPFNDSARSAAGLSLGFYGGLV